MSAGSVGAPRLAGVQRSTAPRAIARRRTSGTDCSAHTRRRPSRLLPATWGEASQTEAKQRQRGRLGHGRGRRHEGAADFAARGKAGVNVREKAIIEEQGRLLVIQQATEKRLEQTLPPRGRPDREV